MRPILAPSRRSKIPMLVRQVHNALADGTGQHIDYFSLNFFISGIFYRVMLIMDSFGPC